MYILLVLSRAEEPEPGVFGSLEAKPLEEKQGRSSSIGAKM